MSEWTHSARAEWDRCGARVRASLTGSEADPTEVIDDLKRHLDTEVARARLEVVTEEDVRRLFRQIGGMELAAAAVLPEAAPAPRAAPPAGTRPGWLLLLFGVLLPVGTLSWEWISHLCAANFFDPIPTFWHGLLVACVPATNLATHLVMRRSDGVCRPWVGWANGIALGIAAFYTLVFLPLTLPGIVCLVYLGLGFVPLTPLISMIATLGYRRHLRSRLPAGGQGRVAGLWRGMALAWAALLLLESPDLLTRIGCDMARSEAAPARARGIRWLRAVGARETLLRFCYDRPRRLADFFSMVLSSHPWSQQAPLSSEEARTLFFRVYGQPFNAEPPPRMYTRGGVWRELEDAFTWDFDQGLGGTAVAGRVKGLSLAASRLDGAVDSRGAVAYLEWTLEFQNQAAVAREARAQIRLPPGAVVSRLTLWVNGEEREAAFAGRSQTRVAYQRVAVERRRDPVLVTTSGPDRVLVQCFPVPPQGGRMKIRLGITAPLDLETLSQGRLHWPVFLERNFSLPADLAHQVWLLSKASLSSRSTGLQIENPEPGRFALRGPLKDPDLVDPAAVVLVSRPADLREVWTTNDVGGQAIRQTIEDRPPVNPSRVALVVDGSQNMTDAYSALAQSLATFPEALELRVTLAADEPIDLLPPSAGVSKAIMSNVAARVRSLRGVGGQDNVAALNQALDWAAQATNGVVLWLHGPQPVPLGALDGLRQRLERRVNGPPVYDLQTLVGPNRILENLEGAGSWVTLTREGTLTEDLQRIFTHWRNPVATHTFRRERLTYPKAPTSVPVSQHVERLWALGECQRLAWERQPDAAIQLAVRHQLVTPLTGAVVLETQAQYQEAGLTPVDPATVPVIPEPSTWALLAMGIAVVVLRDRVFGRVRRSLPAAGKEASD